MNEYIGSKCPVCLTEIKEEDSVKVCPECGTPYHESCWEKNGGCTNEECSQRLHKDKDNALASICLNCGAPLEEGQDFCSECGTPRGEKKKLVCSNCGSELQEGQEFCHKCGQKVGTQSKTDSNPARKKRGKKGIIIGAVALVVVILAALAVFLAPKIFVSVEDLCVQGKYEQAYKKASVEEKNTVMAENIVAFLSGETSDGLKDPSSFLLREAYCHVTYDEKEERLYQQAVLYVSGKNGFGGTVSSYWVYTVPKDGEWSLFGTCSTLTAESEDENVDLLIKAMAKFLIEDDDTITLSKSAVKNINDLFKTGELEKVELINTELFDRSLLLEKSEKDDN